MARHTPGPWKVEFDCQTAVFPGHMIRTADDAECPIALLWVGGGTKGEPRQRAAATLMAAAPDLLAALEGLLPIAAQQDAPTLKETAQRFRAAYAAIAKAKGERHE